MSTKSNHLTSHGAQHSTKEIYDPTKPFNERIRELIRSTHPSSGPIKVKTSGKRFRMERDSSFWSQAYEQECTDGQGTKGLLHWKMGTVGNGVQDVFAMVVDDLMEGGYVPYKLQDHILMQEENKKMIFSAVKSLVNLSTHNRWTAEGKSYPIIVSGGETAIINTIQGFEMGITATGFVQKGMEIRTNAVQGDIILGLGSNGLHSNGTSFWRKELFEDRKMDIHDKAPWCGGSGQSIGRELTKPTHVYLPAIKSALDWLRKNDIIPSDAIHGMVHITGGGMSKLTELLKDDTDINIRSNHKLEPQRLFKYAHYELGASSEKMYKTFNNGIGYVIAVNPPYEPYLLDLFSEHFPTDTIGRVTKGKGRVNIESQYEPKTVPYKIRK